jgi:hypothetical protein
MCKHRIAVHRFTFDNEDGFHEETMQCALCGSAETRRSVMPRDPRLTSAASEEPKAGPAPTTAADHELARAEAAVFGSFALAAGVDDTEEDETTRAVFAANASLINLAAKGDGAAVSRMVTEAIGRASVGNGKRHGNAGDGMQIDNAGDDGDDDDEEDSAWNV